MLLTVMSVLLAPCCVFMVKIGKYKSYIHMCAYERADVENLTASV